MKGKTFDTDRIVWVVVEWIEALERDDAMERLKSKERILKKTTPYPLLPFMLASMFAAEVAAFGALRHKQITRRERIRDGLKHPLKRQNRECSTVSINSGQADARGCRAPRLPGTIRDSQN